MSFIIYQLKNIKRRVLTSATKMKEIPEFTGVGEAVVLNFLGNMPSQKSELKVKLIHSASRDKAAVLFSLLCSLGNTSSLVFCNHRDAVMMISEFLTEKGLKHGIFHGKLEQMDRERTLIKFRNGTFQVLISTDLASRGLDIPEIENVIHFQLPHTEEIFIHRNGRTARMNAKGTAYLILSSNEHVPEFIKQKPETITLTAKDKLPETAQWSTLYIAAGKKDKINKMDIVGMLLQKGKLEKEDLGLIEVLDFSSYAAVKSKKINSLLLAVKNEKIKNKKVKMEISV
jgi:ATP-independent RNA helicase DbpA